MINERLLELPSGAVVPSSVFKQYTNDIGALSLNLDTGSLVSPSGLLYPNNSNLSNGVISRYLAGVSGITDFTITNSYIHYKSYDENEVKTAYINFNPSGLLQLATTRFNIYNAKYRIVPTNLE